jgi:hypothetical protein
VLEGLFRKDAAPIDNTLSQEHIVLLTIDQSDAMSSKWEYIAKLIDRLTMNLKTTDHMGCFVFNERFVNILQDNLLIQLDPEMERSLYTQVDVVSRRSSSASSKLVWVLCEAICSCFVGAIYALG